MSDHNSGFDSKVENLVEQQEYFSGLRFVSKNFPDKGGLPQKTKYSKSGSNGVFGLNIFTVVGDIINTTKTTFDFNFDLYLAVKQYGYT